MGNTRRRLNPQLQQWLDQYNKKLQVLMKEGFKPTPTNVREGLDALTRSLVRTKPEIAWIKDDIILVSRGYPVPVRIYHPDPDDALPVLIYYHGGGHMAGNVSAYDPICRKIAESTHHIVISTDYRLAPECPYPAAVQDAYNAAKSVWATLDSRDVRYRQLLRLAGDSAGGALSATVAHLAQFDAGISIKSQALIYPSLDYTMSASSIEENASGYFLQKAGIQWYFDSYFQKAEDRKAVSPLFMELTPCFPDTLVITAEFCPLRDEGFYYAEKLKKGGIPVEHLHFEDMIHAFLNLESLVPDEAAQVYNRIDAFFNRETS